jgi:hypothetical protein
MEIDKVFDIPAHPLFVHVPVVFVPLTALGLLAIVVRPAWRLRYGWLVAAGAVVSAVGVQLAVMSGEGLEDRIDKNDAIERHIDLARTARPLVFVFAALALVDVALPWWAAHRRGADRPTAFLDRDDGRLEPVPAQPPAWVRPTVALVAGASIVFAGLATTWVVRTGHQGSKATWQGTGDDREDDGGGPGGGDNSGPGGGG